MIVKAANIEARSRANANVRDTDVTKPTTTQINLYLFRKRALTVRDSVTALARRPEAVPILRKAELGLYSLASNRMRRLEIIVVPAKAVETMRKDTKALMFLLPIQLLSATQ